ncbi:hypothetical protein OEZ86_013862 [Tetradesmus obliquus]|nr:hypothetical protein OEZ86_013862 [Tetradesmus obliquus]
MKSSAVISMLLCLALCTGSLASTADVSLPALPLDEEPGVMRRLQGALVDGHDINFLKKTANAADAVKDAIGTKVQGVQHFATHVGKEAAEEVKDVVKADSKVLSKAAKATHSTLKSSGEAIRATGAAIGAGAAHIATAPFGGLFSHAAHKTAEHAKKETKQAVKKAVKGVKKVKRAVAKAADEKADALHDTAKAAAHAVKRASIKNDIAKRLAAMKVEKAVGAGVKAVLKP